MTTKREDLVSAYIKRLRRALRGLSGQQRQEIIDEVTAHIEESLGGSDQPSEADVRNVLERVGDPSEIAREADERFGIPQVKARRAEVATLILIPIGGIILPVLGWVVGVILLWWSDSWTVKEKLIGTFAIPGGLAPWFFLTFRPARPKLCEIQYDGIGRVITDTCSEAASWAEPFIIAGIILLVFVVPIASVVYLTVRLRKHSRVAVPVT